jgi:hypothetical protein
MFFLSLNELVLFLLLLCYSLSLDLKKHCKPSSIGTHDHKNLSKKKKKTKN